MDGTLLDSAPAIIGRLHHTLAEFGVVPPADEELRHLIGPPTQTALSTFLDPAVMDDAVSFYRSLARDEGLAGFTLFPGIADALEQLAQAGVPLAVATSKPQGEAENIVAAFGIATSFSAVVGAEASRPNKSDVVAQALREVETSAENAPLMVGDRRWDIDGAAQYNVPTVLVSWGYAQEEEFSAALTRIDSPAELVSFVLRQEA